LLNFPCLRAVILLSCLLLLLLGTIIMIINIEQFCINSVCYEMLFRLFTIIKSAE